MGRAVEPPHLREDDDGDGKRPALDDLPRAPAPPPPLHGQPFLLQLPGLHSIPPPISLPSPRHSLPPVPRLHGSAPAKIRRRTPSLVSEGLATGGAECFRRYDLLEARSGEQNRHQGVSLFAGERDRRTKKIG
jgi:hypothetical protein